MVVVVSAVIVLSSVFVLSAWLVYVVLVLEVEFTVVSLELFEELSVVVGSTIDEDEDVDVSSWPGCARQAVNRKMQAAPVDENVVCMMRSVGLEV